MSVGTTSSSRIQPSMFEAVYQTRHKFTGNNQVCPETIASQRKQLSLSMEKPLIQSCATRHPCASIRAMHEACVDIGVPCRACVLCHICVARLCVWSSRVFVYACVHWACVVQSSVCVQLFPSFRRFQHRPFQLSRSPCSLANPQLCRLPLFQHRSEP